MINVIIGIELNGLIYSNNVFPEKEEESIISSEDIGTEMYEYEGVYMVNDFKDDVNNNKIRNSGELTVKNQKYVFVMNTKKKCRLDVQKAAELNGYRILFVDNASNMYAEPMPEYCSVYMLQSDYGQKCSMDRLLSTIIAIAEKYKELLKEKGYDVDNMPLTKIYLGCERSENIPLKPSCNN
ncbi:MAG: hypothetical protein GX237_04880 [Clostridiales bacterium]|nr:hypothetical protein [Clostridiales bacterium]